MKKPTKHFYTTIVNVDEVIAGLDVLDLSNAEKKELPDLAHLNLHTSLIDDVLS